MIKRNKATEVPSGKHGKKTTRKMKAKIKKMLALVFTAGVMLVGVHAARAASGSILTVKETQIEIFLGLEDGIYPDQELYIVRGRKLLGKLKVTYVGEMTSWGEIMSLEAGVVPAPGDHVTSAAPSSKGSSKPETNKTIKSSTTTTTTPEKDKTSPPATNTTAPLTTQQKELLSKKAFGKKGKIYLLVENQNQAGITLGKKDGLKEGDEVVVFQENETAGTVKVKTLFEDFSLCELFPSKGKTFKKGDIVLFNPSMKIEGEKSEDKKEEKTEEKKEDKKESPLSSTP